MKRFKEAKVVKLYRDAIDDWFEFYTENGKPGTGKGFLTDHCASYFESATGIKLDKGEECLVKIKIQKVKVKK